MKVEELLTRLKNVDVTIKTQKRRQLLPKVSFFTPIV